MLTQTPSAPLHSSSPATRWERPVVWGFFAALLLVGLWLVRDYGVSYDEPVSRANGMISLRFLAEQFTPGFLGQPAQVEAFAPYSTPLSEYIDRDYGVAFELPATIGERLLRLTSMREIYWFRHLCTFLVCWGGILAVYQLGRRRFADWRWGLFGALLLVLSPRFFAESFYNDKDLVFMALCAIATNTAVRFLIRPTWGRAAVHALACALAIDVRIMAVLWPLATLALLGLRAVRGEYRTVARPGNGWGLLFSVALYLGLLVGFIIVFWPHLWDKPMRHFSDAFRNMMHFRWEGVVLFRGDLPKTTDLPWNYAPVWLGITTPLPHLLLLLLGLVAVLGQLARRHWRLYATDAEWQDLFFVGLGVLPVVAVVALHSVLYDGWRQLYFIYPPLLLLAVRGAQAVATWRFKNSSLTKTWRWFCAAGLAVSLVAVAVRMVQLHPYQNLYFNELAGPDVAHRYEMDYWGLSFLAGFKWIAAHADQAEIKVGVSSDMISPARSNLLMLPDFAQSRIKLIENTADADYFITVYRWHPQDFDFPNEAYRLESTGPRFMSVFRLR